VYFKYKKKYSQCPIATSVPMMTATPYSRMRKRIQWCE